MNVLLDPFGVVIFLGIILVDETYLHNFSTLIQLLYVYSIYKSLSKNRPLYEI